MPDEKRLPIKAHHQFVKPVLSRVVAALGYDPADPGAGTGSEPAIAVGTAADYWRGDKTWQPLTWGALAGKPAFGTMSTQNADSVEITGGTAVFSTTYTGVTAVTGASATLSLGTRDTGVSWAMFVTGGVLYFYNENNVFLTAASTGALTVPDAVLATSFRVGSNQVVGARQAAIANHASDATVNAILTALRNHGLIAT